jgi:hypothetical protein
LLKFLEISLEIYYAKKDIFLKTKVRFNMIIFTSRQRNNLDKQTSVRRTVGYHIPWRSAGDDICPPFDVTEEDITDKSVPGIVSKKTSFVDESIDD